MIECQITAGREYDQVFEHIIKGVVKVVEKKDDDFLLICVGETGTGKSRLMLHGYELFDPQEASVDYIAFNRREHAKAMHLAKKKKNRRFVGDDEANVSKRDALTKYNKDRIDLYYAIRGLLMFHWWNNPSLEMIDKPFIEERVRGVIVVFTKGKPYRHYYYFTKQGILKLLEDHGDLKLRTIKKNARKYAHHRGWFRDYKGRLLAQYLVKKNARMDDKVDAFYNKYGKDDLLTLSQVIKRVGIDKKTAMKYARSAINEGLLPEETHGKLGRWEFTEPQLETFREYVMHKMSVNR